MQLGGISSVLKNIQDFICIIIVFLPIILDRALLSHLLDFIRVRIDAFGRELSARKSTRSKSISGVFSCSLVFLEILAFSPVNHIEPRLLRPHQPLPTSLF